MSNQQKLLVVVGATGSQGGAVINHFLKHEPSFKIRGTTRSPDSSKAQSLANQGIEIVKADLDDVASLEAAFSNANYIYAYTDSAGCAESPTAKAALESGQASSLPEAAGKVEETQGRNIANAAAKIPTLDRLIFSATTEPGEEFFNYEMQAKANALKYMLAKPELKGKVNAVYLAVFTNTYWRFPFIMGWEKKGEGEYVVRVPWDVKAPMPWIDLESDAGTWVSALMTAEPGTVVAAVGGNLSTEDVVEALKRKLGIRIDVEEITLDEYASVEPDGIMREVAQLMRFTTVNGIAGESSLATRSNEFARQNRSVKRSDINQSFERFDWSGLL